MWGKRRKMARIRRQSLAEVDRLGFSTNQNLPLLDAVSVRRKEDEVADRLLTLNAVTACSFGFAKASARAWIEQEGLWESVTATERGYLDCNEASQDRAERDTRQWAVQSLWTLAWSLRCHEQLAFTDPVGNEFVRMLPDIKQSESSASFRSGLRLRSDDEILTVADLAYCLHWAVRDAMLHGVTLPVSVEAGVVVERRRALEWLIGEEGWDEVAMDT